MKVMNGAGVVYVPPQGVDPITGVRDISHPDCEHGFVYVSGLEWGGDYTFQSGESLLPVRFFIKDAKNPEDTRPKVGTSENSRQMRANQLMYERRISTTYIRACFESIRSAEEDSGKFLIDEIRDAMERWAGLELT